MKFLLSRYVLILILAVLVLEGAVRLGFYEPLVNPQSHSGTSINLKRALKAFGKENLDVITLVDSRAVQGLNNQLIFVASGKYGLNHIRMSMPGRHFLTFKTLAACGTEELPALRGIVLALSPANFGWVGSGAYESAIVLPLRNKTSTREMLHHVPFDRSDMRTYASIYSIAGYREDIKGLLSEPGLRLDALKKRAESSPVNLLTFNGEQTTDICAVATDDPAACLDELERVRADTPPKAWSALNTLCKAAVREPKEPAAGQAEEALAGEWTTFLENLSRKVRVMVVLLPDHSLFKEHLFAPSAMYVANKVLGELDRKGVIDLVDLNGLIKQQDDRECSFFMDARHLNNKGKQLFTQAVLPELDKFWRQLVMTPE
jgi:hypothetical protein